MSPWKIIFHKFDPEKEQLREALCTLGSGYLGTRGAMPEVTASQVHYPGTYIAGVYNALVTRIAGKDILNEDFVNCPNWLMLHYRIDDGPWFDRAKAKFLSWKYELNMRRGILSRRMRWQDEEGRITLVEDHRMVSMAEPHLCGLCCTFTPENYDGRLTIRCGIDGMILNSGVERYKQLNSKHLEPIGHGSFGKDGIFLQMRTNQSGIEISEAQRTLVFAAEERIQPEMHVILHGRERIIHEFSLDVKKGQRYTVEKLVGVFTSRDHGVPDNALLAQETVSTVESFQALYKPHQARWRSLWRRFDIEVDGDPFLQSALRLHTFHLLQTASPHNEDIDAGLPARGLHGEAYRGHVFWDELFAYPCYTLRAPEISRALLLYRYRRLNAARGYARQHGFSGAMFPWQSASTGEETTQTIHLNPLSGEWGADYSSCQRHISIAIAHNVWMYYYMTGDRDFMDRYGIEMIVQIAHFLSSMAQWNQKTGRFDIEGVMGPDEFHEKYPDSDKGGLKNNAYTNVLSVWVIERARHLLAIMADDERKALLLKTGIDEQELARWQKITRKMAVPMDKNGLMHQFEGYRELKELDWEAYRARYDNIHRIDRILKAEGLSPDDYKVSKQPDVLMIFFLLKDGEIARILRQLGYRSPKDLLKTNYDYYIQRTSHGSTLSRVVHCYLAKRLGYEEDAWNLYRESLESDLRDIQGGTAQEGIHAGVMGGTIDLFWRCYAGLEILDDGIGIRPALPPFWKKARFHVRYKNIWFDIQISNRWVKVQADPIEETALPPLMAVPMQINDKIYKISVGKVQKINLQRKRKTVPSKTKKVKP